MGQHSAAAIVLLCFTVFSSTLSLAVAANDFHMSATEIGLLINFSIPCGLDASIDSPYDKGGLLTPNLLAVGSQQYTYDGSKWVLNSQQATLYNKTLNTVGSLAGGKDGEVVFSLKADTKSVGTTEAASVTAKPFRSVIQRFAIPLQLLNVTSYSKTSNYYAANYVYRFATQQGLAPGSDYKAKKGEIFNSRFTALYAWYLPASLSPQLATRVPTCGDERFYGLQYGRDF